MQRRILEMVMDNIDKRPFLMSYLNDVSIKLLKYIIITSLSQ